MLENESPDLPEDRIPEEPEISSPHVAEAQEERSSFAPFESRLDLSELRAAVEQVRQEMGKIIVGQSRMVDLMVAAILADGHILIEGVPGVAKTLAAKLLARTIDVGFSRIQFTPDLMPSDVLGTSVFNNKKADFEFHKGPIFSNLVLIDEINRAPAKTQAALFEVMQERQITLDGETYQMEPPFMVLATQNPIEQEGTYRLPEAQLDRFLFKIEVGYPDEEEETRILTEFHQRKGLNDPTTLQPVLNAASVARFQELVRSLYIDPKLIAYIVALVHRTRQSQDLYLGASPRAAIHILATAKAIAAMRGRDFVVPEDIQYVAPPVLQHRILLTPEREMEGITPAQVVRSLMESIEVPR